MKTLALFFIILFGLFSCDEFVKEIPDSVPGVEKPGDDPDDPDNPKEPDDPLLPGPDIISIKGERWEKYYLEADPFASTRIVTLESPIIVAHEHGGTLAFNQLTLHDVLLGNLISPTPFVATATGTLAVTGRAREFTIAYSLPVEIQAWFSPEGRAYPLEPYKILKPFENPSNNLILPSTGDYSSFFSSRLWRTFSISVPSNDFMYLNENISFQTQHNGQNLVFSINAAFPTDMVCSRNVLVTLVARGRNFYQYSNLTIVFAPEKIISNIKTEPIVSDYFFNRVENSIAINFAEYDKPHLGIVFSCDITDGGHTGQIIIRIGVAD